MQRWMVMGMVELIDKWEVISKLITLQNNYNFFKNEWDAKILYREIAKLEIKIGKTPGIELVRCKDCKYSRIASWGEKYCVRKQSDGVHVELSDLRDEDFCSYGER